MWGDWVWAPNPPPGGASDAVDTVLKGSISLFGQVIRDPVSRFNCNRLLNLLVDVYNDRYVSLSPDGPYVFESSNRIIRTQSIDHDTGQVYSEVVTMTSPTDSGEWSWSMDMSTGNVTEPDWADLIDGWTGLSDIPWALTESAGAHLGALGGTAEQWSMRFGPVDFPEKWYKYHNHGKMELSNYYTIQDCISDAFYMVGLVPYILGQNYTDEAGTTRSVTSGSGCHAVWLPAVPNVSGKRLVFQHMDNGVSVGWQLGAYGVRWASFLSARAFVAKSKFRSCGRDVLGIENWTQPVNDVDTELAPQDCQQTVFAAGTGWQEISWENLSGGYGYCKVDNC